MDLDTERERPEEKAAEFGSGGISVDVTDAAAVKRALRDVVGATGGLDAVVANAGIVLPATFLGTTDEIWRAYSGCKPDRGIPHRQGCG